MRHFDFDQLPLFLIGTYTSFIGLIRRLLVDFILLALDNEISYSRSDGIPHFEALLSSRYSINSFEGKSAELRT